MPCGRLGSRISRVATVELARISIRTGPPGGPPPSLSPHSSQKRLSMRTPPLADRSRYVAALLLIFACLAPASAGAQTETRVYAALSSCYSSYNCYATPNSAIEAVNVATGARVGNIIQIPGLIASAVQPSPDGSRVYVILQGLYGVGGGVGAYDTATGLQTALRAPRSADLGGIGAKRREALRQRPVLRR
jgi:hypothetical protein